jgi:acyl-CoA reductase-like NAD-dependent aldehyde dehydrogenase
LKAAFKTGKTHSVDFRLGQLQRILDMINENEDALAEAISLDGKSKREAVVADIITTKKEVKTFMANLRSWLNPAPYSLGLIFTASMDSAKAVYEPLGTVLVIGTWNYPFNTAICPLIGAIGGGNTVALKLSEIAEHTATLLTDLIPRYLDQDVCRVVNGSVDVATELLKLRWDHIFYTGNTQVGKIIAKAAAEHLTTCTLELGGKSPCIIDRNVDLVLAAKRIAYGKLLNCGQTCVAPDYLLIPKDIRDEFLEHFKEAINEIYGEFGATKDWVDYGRIVNERHFQRLKSYLDNTKGEVFLKGEQNEKDLIFGPTVVINPSDSEPLSKDEIFGPILSVIDCESVEHAIEYINSREKPLACYVFSNDSFQLDQVQRLVPAGNAYVFCFIIC